LFRAFFPPIFWSRYSCDYKKRFFALFSNDFFFQHFLLSLFLRLWKNSSSGGGGGGVVVVLVVQIIVVVVVVVVVVLVIVVVVVVV